MNLAGFDLNLLKVLDALLREGSTVRAGARIGLSQPAVSAALGRLRHALGDPLFVRQGTGLVPTDRARALERPLRDILDRIEALAAAAEAFDPARSEDVFRISGADFFAELLMPRLGAELAREAPLMRVQLLDLVPEDYVATVDQRRADLVMIPKAELPDWIEAASVLVSPYAVIARRDHPRLDRAGLRPGEVVPLDLFCDLGHVLFSPEGKFRSVGDEALARVGRERRVVMTLPFFAGVCRAVSGSDLVALIPRQFGASLAAPLALELYAPPMPLTAAEILMIWHRRATGNPAHRWLREKVARILADISEPDPGR